MDVTELIKLAVKAREKAVAPYSSFKVGAVVVTSSGRVFSGCNVESSSYGLTMCAERVAIFKALSEGESVITRVAVVADTEREILPCGACRQVMSEFAADAEVVCANLNGHHKTYRMSELLPHAFRPGDLR